jgi:hypothetical protein
VTARLYDKSGSYQQISSQEAIVDQRSGTLLYGPHLDKSLRLSTRE